MNKFLTLTAEQRRAVFERVGVNVGLPMQAVEKDFYNPLIIRETDGLQKKNIKKYD